MASTTIKPVLDADFAALIAGHAPAGLAVAIGGIEQPDVLTMLRELAAKIAAQFEPSAWMILADGEVVGLCSLVAMPAHARVQIGYGIAPSRRRRGHATGAVAAVLAWASQDVRVAGVDAETRVDNRPSQTVLERCGFAHKGMRHDAEDGDLICWSIDTPLSEPARR